MPLAIPASPTTSLPAAQPFSTGKSLISDALALELEASFANVRAGISAFQTKPELDASLTHAREAVLQLAEAVAQIPKRAHAEEKVAAVRALLKEISVSGIHDTPATADQLLSVERFAQLGWPGLLAGMCILPAWQWAEAPALDAAPDWFWGDYVAWLFTSPQGFCAVGQADRFAAHCLKRLDELCRWVDRNSGSAAVRSALAAYIQTANCIPLYFSRDSLKQHATLRGRLLSRTFARGSESYDPFPEPRANRKLRVGFVNRHFGSQTETYTTLPTFEQLDRSRFDVILFAHQTSEAPLEQHCRARSSEFYHLTGDTANQLSVLRAAALDIVVFGTNVTAVCNPVTLLALHRVAPLQVVNNSSCITSGLPEVDMYVSGTLTEIGDASAHFTERLGLLPGPAHAFNYEADKQEPASTWARANLGIPEDATVFVSAANYFKIIPEMQHAWARLLAATPGSYLVVHPFNPNWSASYPVQRFCAEFDRVLREHGVEGTRFIVSTIRFASRNDVKELLRVGDVYLDTYPFGGVNSLVDPLELGMPIVAWEGDTFRSRMGGALLRTLQLPELVVNDETSYLKTAQTLATNRDLRTTLKGRIDTAMARQPIFLDSLAASDAFGDLIEVAFDEIVNVGRAMFRADRAPLLAANFQPPVEVRDGSLTQARQALRSSPGDAKARHAVGRALADLGDYTRASEYYVAAVQQDENNAELWYDLAFVFRRSGQSQLALQSLETSLRLDGQRLDAWLMFAELAKNVGNDDLAREAAGVAKRLAPSDSRADQYL